MGKLKIILLKIILPIVAVSTVSVSLFVVLKDDKPVEPQVENNIQEENRGNEIKDEDIKNDENEEEKNVENDVKDNNIVNNITSDEKNITQSNNNVKPVEKPDNGTNNQGNDQNKDENDTGDNNNEPDKKTDDEIKYIIPSAKFSTDGITDAKEAKTKINVSGDYTKVEYAISTTNVYDNVTTWKEYTLGSEITITNENTLQYVIVRLTSKKDGNYVYEVSKAFNMIPWEEPTAVVVKNSASNEREAKAKINVSGDYTKVEYIVSTTNVYEDVTTWKEYTLDSEITITNDELTQYIIVRLTKKNGSYVYKVSDVFNMIPWVVPSATFAPNGIVDAKEAKTKINVSGDYTKVEYAISTTNAYEDVTTWKEYTLGSEITITNENTLQYVIVRLTSKKDGSYVYEVSKSFNMIPWEEPTAVVVKNSASNEREAKAKINVSGDYTKVEYIVSTTNVYEDVTTWKEYTLDSEITITNDELTQYIIVRLTKKNGSYVYKVSDVFNMIPWEEPTAVVVKNSASNEREAKAKINVSGDYTKVEYIVSTTNVYEDVTTWKEYTLDSEITITNDEPIQYIIVRLTSEKDGSYVYKVSEAFNMIPWVVPSATFAPNGIVDAKEAKTKINVSGDYTKVEYAISTTNVYEDVILWTEYTLDSEITITNDEPIQYVIVRLTSEKDGSYIYKVSNAFNMIPWVDPSATFTTDGVIGAKEAKTKINVSGDYTKVEYAISTTNVYEDVTLWTEYTLDSEITITNDEPTQYVIARLTSKKDGSYVYKVSEAFNMIPWVDPSATFSQNGNNTAAYSHTTSFTVSGDYDSLEYAVYTSTVPENIPSASWVSYIEGENIEITYDGNDNLYVTARIGKKNSDEYVYCSTSKFAMKDKVILNILFSGTDTDYDVDLDLDVSKFKFTVTENYLSLYNVSEVTYKLTTNDSNIAPITGNYDKTSNQIVIQTAEDVSSVTYVDLEITITFSDGTPNKIINIPANIPANI